MHQGYISLHRQIQDNWVWKDRPFSKGQAWIDLLLLANHEDNKVPVESKIISVKRGERLTSILWLSERWGWSRKKVSNFLNILTKQGQITQNRTSKYTLITIDNYDLYQDVEHQKNITGTSKEHHGNTNNNDNNDNNDNKDICPYKEIQNLFNNVCVSLPKVQKLTNSRKDKLKTRWNEMPDIERWKLLFETVEEIPFLKGENKDGWTATFDWLVVNDKNYLKVLEGNYKSKKVKGEKENGADRYDIRNMSEEDRRFFGH